MQAKHLYKFLTEEFKCIIKGDLSALSNFKYFKAWEQSLGHGHDSMTDRMPWISFPAIDFLQHYLKPDHKVFEFGGGGSTLYFIDKVSLVVTVEHDEKWFLMLKENIGKQHPERWEGHMVLPEKMNSDKVCDPSNPDDYASADPLFLKHSFKKYASTIDSYPDQYFDVVLVDGRARPSCIRHSANKIKRGGVLILDNAGRDYYLSKTSAYLAGLKQVLKKNGPLPYINFFERTYIWIKQ